MLSVRLERPAERFVEKLKDKALVQRILDKLEKLKSDPFPPEAVRVQEYRKDKVFRVRVGDYRILYHVNYERGLIMIVNIDKRPRAY